jgi:hypothetical protein
MGDCCGDCPIPNDSEERTTERPKDELFVSGVIKLSRSGPSRQHKEVVHPWSQQEYTGPAYVAVTDPLCGAIADCDLSRIQHLLAHGGNDINERDINGRTPLHLAVACSTLEVVQCLLDHGAQLTPLTEDGKAVSHIACVRGSVAIVSALLTQNEEDKVQHKLGHDTGELSRGQSGFDDINISFSQHGTSMSLLHLAILHGNGPLVKFLVQTFNGDINQSLSVVEASVNRGDAFYDGLEQYLPPVSLALRLPLDAARKMTRLFLELGASSEQKVDEYVSALQACITSRPVLLDTYFDADARGAARATAAVSTNGELVSHSGPALGYGKKGECAVSAPLLTAIQSRDTNTALKLLEKGAKAILPFEAFTHVMETLIDFQITVAQPVILAVEEELPLFAITLIRQHGADVNTLTPSGWKAVHQAIMPDGESPESLLDCVYRRIERLESWIQNPHEPRFSKPDETEQEPMRGNVFYLVDYAEDSYSYYSCDMKLDQERERLESWHGMPRQSKTVHAPTVGFKKKLAIIKCMLDEFIVLRELLHDRSAKSFQDLHPQVVTQKQTPPPEDDSTADHEWCWGPKIRHGYSMSGDYRGGPTTC